MLHTAGFSDRHMIQYSHFSTFGKNYTYCSKDTDSFEQIFQRFSRSVKYKQIQNRSSWMQHM